MSRIPLIILTSLGDMFKKNPSLERPIREAYYACWGTVYVYSVFSILGARIHW